MEYLLVAAVAALAGFLAYRLSTLLGRKPVGDEALEVPPPGPGPAGDEALEVPPTRAPAPTEPRGHRRRGSRDPLPAPDAFAYGAGPLPPSRTTLRTRLLGLLGLIALIVLAAALIAVALYQAGHLVRLQFESYLR